MSCFCQRHARAIGALPKPCTRHPPREACCLALRARWVGRRRRNCGRDARVGPRGGAAGPAQQAQHDMCAACVSRMCPTGSVVCVHQRRNRAQQMRGTQPHRQLARPLSRASDASSPHRNARLMRQRLWQKQQRVQRAANHSAQRRQAGSQGLQRGTSCGAHKHGNAAAEHAPRSRMDETPLAAATACTELAARRLRLPRSSVRNSTFERNSVGFSAESCASDGACDLVLTYAASPKPT